MRPTLTIFKREFLAFVTSPIAYIVIPVFLIVVGWFFFSTFFIYSQASLRNFFSLLPITFSLMVPAITMRLFAEEMNTGSYETLMTLPITRFDAIVGKFLAAWALVALMLSPTLLYPITISLIGTLDWGPVIGGYLGALLLAAAYAAVGVFASSLTRNQIVAFIIGVAVCFTLTMIDKMLFFMPPILLKVFETAGADIHFQNIAKGVIDTRDILYFLSVGFLALAATRLVLENKA
uniref:ABC transporter n=1 Tax=Desulfatirhabdium butyrativorans TaxID=340467 RepID=A0A7C4MNN3_9BACT